MSGTRPSANPAAEIAAGYAFSGPALELGALLWDRVCLPENQIRIPLGMLNHHGLVAAPPGPARPRRSS